MKTLDDEVNAKPLSKALFSKTFQQLFLMGFLTICNIIKYINHINYLKFIEYLKEYILKFYLVYQYMIINTNKTFGNLNGLNDIDLNYLEIIFWGVNGVARLVWGYLIDNVKFKILYTVLLTLQVKV